MRHVFTLHEAITQLEITGIAQLDWSSRADLPLNNVGTYLSANVLGGL